MSNNNNSLSDVILDQTLFILENYVEIMSIVHNTQAQINRQQQNRQILSLPKIFRNNMKLSSQYMVFRRKETWKKK